MKTTKQSRKWGLRYTYQFITPTEPSIDPFDWHGFERGLTLRTVLENRDTIISAKGDDYVAFEWLFDGQIVKEINGFKVNQFIQIDYEQLPHVFSVS